MTVAEFVRYLKKKGIIFKAHRSRHDVYWNKKQVLLHKYRDINPVILKKVLWKKY